MARCKHERVDAQGTCLECGQLYAREGLFAAPPPPPPQPTAEDLHRILNPPRARKSDPDTSHESAAHARIFNGKTARAILDAIDERGPLTSHAIAELKGIGLVSVSPTIKPLRLAGYLIDTGRRDPVFPRRKLWGRPQSSQ